jgi:hypothetical protein
MQVDEDGSGEVDIMEFINMISIKMDGKNLDDKTPFQMVRAALESVRMDVRAIYGSSAKPKGAMERMRELEMEGKQRCCFFRTDGPTRQDKFRKLWDVLQVFLLVYVAIMVPYRTGFQVDIPTLSAEFWCATPFLLRVLLTVPWRWLDFIRWAMTLVGYAGSKWVWISTSRLTF